MKRTIAASQVHGCGDQDLRGKETLVSQRSNVIQTQGCPARQLWADRSPRVKNQLLVSWLVLGVMAQTAAAAPTDGFAAVPYFHCIQSPYELDPNGDEP